MKTYSLKVSGYSTNCNVKAKSIVHAINSTSKALNVTIDDILEVKLILRPITVEYEFKR